MGKHNQALCAGFLFATLPSNVVKKILDHGPYCKKLQWLLMLD